MRLNDAVLPAEFQIDLKTGNTLEYLIPLKSD